MTETIQMRRKKLKFRAWRRGIKEMDLIMGTFANQHIDHMDEATLAEFERLCDLSDLKLYSWISGTKKTPPEYDTPLLDQLKSVRP